MARINASYAHKLFALHRHMQRNKLTAAENSALSVLIQYTWEQNRDVTELTMHDFMRAMNNPYRVSIDRALAGLVEKGYLAPFAKDYTFVRTYVMQCIPDEIAA